MDTWLIILIVAVVVLLLLALLAVLLPYHFYTRWRSHARERREQARG